MHSVHLEDQIAIITLDDGKANAVGHALLDTVEHGLDQALASAKGVLLCGKSGLFSAGFDLKEFENGPAATEALVNRGAHFLLRLFTHPQPVVAACTGHAVAAGALMLLCADTRIGVDGNFQIGLNETAIGMTLPEFGLQLAAARISKRHQTAAVIQSQLFTPNEAIDAGYLDQVCGAEELTEIARAKLEELTALPIATYAHNKVASRRTYIERIEESLS